MQKEIRQHLRNTSGLEKREKLITIITQKKMYGGAAGLSCMLGTGNTESLT